MADEVRLRILGLVFAGLVFMLMIAAMAAGVFWLWSEVTR